MNIIKRIWSWLCSWFAEPPYREDHSEPSADWVDPADRRGE